MKKVLLALARRKPTVQKSGLLVASSLPTENEPMSSVVMYRPLSGDRAPEAPTPHMMWLPRPSTRCSQTGVLFVVMFMPVPGMVVPIIGIIIICWFWRSMMASSSAVHGRVVPAMMAPMLPAICSRLAKQLGHIDDDARIPLMLPAPKADPDVAV